MTPCIICGNINTKRVIKMGFHPLADTFLTKKQLTNPLKFYPLNCLICARCGHFQNEVFVPGKERYVESGYSYTASNSPSATGHWDEFCVTVSKFSGLTPGDPVIEFGSNDGYLLGQFKKKGFKTAGIDPSPEMAEIANKKNLYTINDFLNKKSIGKAVKKIGKAKLLIGNNVLNHIEKVNDAISSVKFGLARNGSLVIEVPYLSNVIQKYLFDMIFHEHVSTFSVKSIDYLLRKHGLYIEQIENIPYHGGSIRVYAAADSAKYNKELVRKMTAVEEKAGLFKAATYSKFMAKIISDKNRFLTKLYILKKKGKKIAAVGAGARSNTLLNFYRLDPTIIEFVTDASIHKRGKFTPGSNIEIEDDSALKTKKVDVAVITAWNIGKYLEEKIKKSIPGIQFLVPGEKELM